MMRNEMTSCGFIVTLPPPTPNGGLHLGHMAGPFLAADIFTKAMQAKGHNVQVLSYSDSNQSYVRATAEKQERDPAELALTWTKDILKTLDVYGCQVDLYFEPHADSNDFVREVVLRLYEEGHLRKKQLPFFYSLKRRVFLDEAGVSGNCPKCLDDCKCGICEACGFPTRADTLLNPRSTNDLEEQIELRTAEVLVLELEEWRDRLIKFHDAASSSRPRYRWLVKDALEERLPAFPVSVPGDWGIALDHVDLRGQVINAWAELVLDFVFGYRRIEIDYPTFPRIVNFFGYDNSYFYALVHTTLLMAAGLDRYLPHATIINEFYNLENAKFSTSRDHLIWANALAKDFPADLIRFYLALTAPGFEQGNFSNPDMHEVIKRRLLAPYQRIASRLNASAGKEILASSTVASRMAGAMRSRVSHSLTVERFNLRQAAEDMLKALVAIEYGLARGQLDVSDAFFLLGEWAKVIAPIMPSVSVNLGRSLGVTCSGVTTVPETLPTKAIGPGAIAMKEMPNV